MRSLRRTSFVFAALAGLVAAYGVASPGRAMELPPAPTVSVPVPPAPVPVPVPVPVPAPVPVPVPVPVPAAVPVPVPVPPAPSPPVPGPPPAAPVPIPSVPTVPPAAAPPAAAAARAPALVASSSVRRDAATPSSGPASPAAESPSSSGSSTWSTGSTSERGPAAAERRQRLEAKPQRLRNRVAVRLEFTLPARKRVFIVVRGPLPSCAVAGVIPFRGRRGENAARFSGRVRGELLEPGVYLLTISPTRRLQPGAPTEYARVASPRRTVPLPVGAERPSCESAQSEAAATARFLTREADGGQGPAPGAAAPSVPLRPPLVPKPPAVAPEGADGGVAGAFPSPDEIGTAARDSAGEALATLAVLALVGLLLLAMLGLVTRFVRGTWNP